ncbi:MAG: 23S rRNA (guanosine(2251)-2'-O)-methyltransferase RlmB [Pseudomonadota bacterium]
MSEKAEPMSKPTTKLYAKRPHTSMQWRHTAAARRSQRVRKDDNFEDPTLIYGIHAVAAVLNNPRRTIDGIYLTQNAQNRLSDALAYSALTVMPVAPKDLDRRLGADTVHQGALVECSALAEPSLAELIAIARSSGTPIVVLDQITDPHNVGAILRSCAVFGAAGVVTTRRHSPPLAGTVAKSASGALELVPVALIPNLARGLADLTNKGFRVIGLDGEGSAAIEHVLTTRQPTAIVLGAEGRGLRQSTRDACTSIARIHAEGNVASLNVSNAAAVTLHTHALLRRGSIVTAHDKDHE